VPHAPASDSSREAYASVEELSWDEQVKAPTLCPVCTAPLVPTSHSSVVRRLLAAEQTLTHLLAEASKGPMPEDGPLPCDRHEAEPHHSIHRGAAEPAGRVIELADTVADAPRVALVRYERVH
jgi:hypothetical protein